MSSVPPITPISKSITFEQMNALIAFRTLWLEYTLWTRDFVNSIIANHPNQTAITNRLYTGVPLDFYNAMTVFYGPEVAEQLLGLQSRDILRIWRLVDAIKSNRQDLVSEITVALFEGANENAAFLSNINSYWDQATWRNFFIQYYSMLNELILSIMEGNYENEIRVFDRMENLAVLMGNYMARGIIQSSFGQPIGPVQADQ
ncbi:MAG: hypothetical protein ACOX4J_05165 [Anaerovoracaceae bacterium]|jgi:hypothetical protein